MMKFAFRDWLTFEDAAKYMKAVTGQECPTSTIEDAVYKGALTAYFYTPEPIGLYSEDPSYYHETHSQFAENPDFLKDYTSNESFIAYKETAMLIPITHYWHFKKILKNADKLTQPIRGLSAYAESGGLLGGFFDMDENCCPLSLLKVPHLILVARSHLDQLAKVPVVEWLHYRSPPAHIEAAESVNPFTGEPDIIIWSPAGTPHIDETIEQELTQSNPAAKPADPDTEKGLIGTQRALALAVHLLVEVAEQLDNTAEYQSKPISQLYSLAKKNGNPTITQIAAHLAETAKRKNLTGRGFSGSHLGEIITQALKEHGL